MSLPSSLRSAVPLVLGLVIGGAAAIMFADSLPGEKGSPEERARKLEVELQRAQNRIASLEAAQKDPAQPDSVLARVVGGDTPGHKRSAADAARRIAERLRAGQPANPEDIFRASQPLMRDLAPLFDRMRVKAMKEQIEGMAGQYGREYDLSPEQEKQLQQFFERRVEAEAQQWSALMENDNTRFEDITRVMMRAGQRESFEDGLDDFMPSILPIEQQEKFKAERQEQRLQRVEREADAKTTRLDSIVQLDEAQKDQVFGIMARTSKDYRPTMAIEGVQGPVTSTPRGDRQSAVLSVLTPQQRALYDADRKARREKAAKDSEAIGIALPESWDAMEENFP